MFIISAITFGLYAILRHKNGLPTTIAGFLQMAILKPKLKK